MVPGLRAQHWERKSNVERATVRSPPLAEATHPVAVRPTVRHATVVLVQPEQVRVHPVPTAPPVAVSPRPIAPPATVLAVLNRVRPITVRHCGVRRPTVSVPPLRREQESDKPMQFANYQ
jgi:hypothetical protein